MNVKFVDGLVEQLKGQTPLQEMDGNPIYPLMQEKTLDAVVSSDSVVRKTA